jgi:hypothetical protein
MAPSDQEREQWSADPDAVVPEKRLVHLADDACDAKGGVMKVMPKRGGYWPDCLGVLVIMALVFGTGIVAGHFGLS